jgi:hypothetical protein
MNSTIPLFAVNEDWVKIVILAIGGLIYLINHFLGAAKAQQRRPMRPEGRPEARPPRPRAVGGRQDVPDEVAEFLKRAAEKRTATAQAEPRPGQPRRVADSPAGLPSAEIVEARAIEELPSGRWPNPMQPHLESSDLAERSGHSASADRADAAFHAHMQVFEHQVGRFHESAANASPGETHSDAAPQTINAPPNEVFAALLSDPQSLRQAIILNEIIERPVERWS